MCGIMGLVNGNGLNVDRAILRNGRDQLIHRGPDAAGEYADDFVYLGFRRLAILDLSPEGQQPMASDDDQIQVVFNGEIYNFLELRAELERKGYTFHSRSDTEVLIYLYQEYQTQMFEQLNGMFALVIYDCARHKLTLARDRLGKKPLFYAADGQRLLFGSELRALRGLPGFPSEFDPLTLGYYTRLGWVPDWMCIYPAVHKLPPATWLQFDLPTGQLNGPHHYWNLPPVQVDDAYSEEQWLDRIQELLWDSVRLRLRSDVPLGVFLSGGIDSSLVTVAAAAQTRDRVNSLTISLPDWQHDEWPLARQTAEQLGTTAIHRELRVEGLDVLPAIAGQFDEPFADSSALPTALVCQAAREHVTVALSGDGGDEVFAGYRNHVQAWRWRWLDKWLPVKARRWPSWILSTLFAPDSRPRRFLWRWSQPVAEWGLGAMMYPFEDWLADCIRPEFQVTAHDLLERFAHEETRWSTTAAVDAAQRIDLRQYLLNDILVKVDRMSMRYSLEVRSPFLDYRVVELGLRIPPALRVKNGQNKYLLRRLARRHLPSAISEAPKRGFGIPLYEWLFKSSATKQFKEVICTPSTQIPEPLVPGGGEGLWARAQNNEALTSATYRLLVYRWWAQSLIS
jgi:asparagine synthase (glutamine-hydrolysing)